MSGGGRRLRLLVFEHFSARRPGLDPSALRRAGGGLLHAIRDDMAALPGLRVAVVPPGARPAAAFRRALQDADAALVVAPESGGILGRYLRLADRRGVRLLGSGPRAARLAGDKLATLRLLGAAGIPVPACARLTRSRVEGLGRRPRPFVLKPRDGCGAEGVSIVRASGEIRGALRRARAAAGRGDVLVEAFEPGIPASVSLLVSPPRPGRPRSATRRIRVLALGRQRIAGRSALRYLGGILPWRPARRREAIDVAVRAVVALVRATRDVRGLVGVDLVMGPDGPRVLEINPRPTSSYLGLRHVMTPGPGRLLDAVLLAGRGGGRVRLGAPVLFDAAGRVRAATRRSRAEQE